MKASQHKSACIWLAVAIMAVASVARAEPGTQRAAAYANPVLQLLAGHSPSASLSAPAVPRMLRHRAVRGANELFGGDSGAWNAILPVLFVGLMSPLSILSPRSVLSLGRTPDAPVRPSLYQRPPPLQLA
ncbi:MAG TPA: hypothetical protein VKB38_24905 [Terracidiphilus sp.]|nr:hypothetical protein [Terracidiphilus sp.]